MILEGLLRSLPFLTCGQFLGRVALVAQRPIVIKLSRGRYVGLHCGKTADRIRMPFDVVGLTGPGTRQVQYNTIQYNIKTYNAPYVTKMLFVGAESEDGSEDGMGMEPIFCGHRWDGMEVLWEWVGMEVKLEGDGWIWIQNLWNRVGMGVISVPVQTFTK